MLRLAVACFAALTCVSVSATPTVSNTYQTLVNDKGDISLPVDFQRNWSFLGTWSVAKSGEDSNDSIGAQGLHNVYVQPDAIDDYRRTGKFSDGTVFIKELLQASTGPMTTGTISWGSKVDGWFVMVKDDHQRFPGNKLWGDGWGWVLINADAPTKAAATDYKIECKGCHIPAQKNDWIYIEGYPSLQGN
jgi:hypothetical protein